MLKFKKFALNEAKTIKVSFHSAAAKAKWMKKQSIDPKEIISQTKSMLELPASMKQYVQPKDHDEIYSTSIKEEVELDEASWTAATSAYAATRKRDLQRQDPKHNFRVGDAVNTKGGKSGTVAFVDGEKIHVKGTNPYYPDRVTHHTASELKKGVAEEVELDEGKLDKSSPIYKEYEALKKKSVADLRNTIGRSHRVADLKGYDKAGAIRQILDDKYGEKKVDAFFGFNEEAELDEISKKTLGSYVKKAGASMASHGVAVGSGRNTEKSSRAMANRMKGMNRAADRLTKEEVELDEAQWGVDNPYTKYKNDPEKLRRMLQKNQDAASNMRNRISKFMGSSPSGLKDELRDIEKRIAQIKDVMRMKSESSEYEAFKNIVSKVRLKEGRSEAIKALEKLASSGGIDKADFQKALDLYKANKLNDLRKHIYRLDTDPSEAIASVIDRHDSKAFNSMYPRASSGDYVRKIVLDHGGK